MSNNIIDQSYQITRQKIILIGDIAVGKTCIINSILGHKFKGEYEASIIVDFFSKTMRYKSKDNHSGVFRMGPIRTGTAGRQADIIFGRKL